MSRPTNHLRGQTSPYLLQHVHNPVDWYPWGTEALAKARDEDKPIFLSIGYAACHWCHVMERESFENEGVAELLNRNFVAIKVVFFNDTATTEIYTNAVQLMTGAGGWPLNMFLTPDLRPFFGGTYFPPETRYGRPGFADVLGQIHDAWENRQPEIRDSAGRMTEQLQLIAAGPSSAAGERGVGRAEMSRAVADLMQRFDARFGGFGPAPKFPADGSLTLLLREHARSGEAVPLQVAEKTLDAMAAGGIYDHVGGGFARYSVDDAWLVPHFEKMLYNQALLVPVYLDAWQLTAKPAYRRVVEQTLDFVRRELTDGLGGFYSSLDADSEGVEGKFYVWTPDEVRTHLGSEYGARFAEIYDVSDAGNFEGRSIPNLLRASLADHAARGGSTEDEIVARLEPSRLALLDARGARVRPGTDDKVLTAWNGLMISAFARAFQVLGRAEDLVSARRAADFLIERMVKNGRLLVSFREGRAQLNGYLDEYAFLGRGLLDLYEACFEPAYLRESARFARVMIERFGDSERGGFFFTSDDHEQLLTRNRSLHDGALPSGSGVASELLLRLALHLDAEELRAPAVGTLRAYHPIVERAPAGFSSLLLAADFVEGPVSEIAVVGDLEDPLALGLLAAAGRRFLPRRALAAAAEDAMPPELALLNGKRAIEGRPTAYVCRDYVCNEPTQDPEQVARLLGASGSHSR
jgi:uncharacterized protein YyaL (SSP411 family)